LWFADEEELALRERRGLGKLYADDEGQEGPEYQAVEDDPGDEPHR
jgi:hypothetical protein